jgi:hypothetical protein
MFWWNALSKSLGWNTSSTRLHDVTIQKTILGIFTAVRTSISDKTEDCQWQSEVLIVPNCEKRHYRHVLYRP